MSAIDTFKNSAEGDTSPVSHGATVVASDSEELTNVTRAIYIGGEGDLKVKTLGNETITFESLSAGQLLPIRVKQIFSTGTTATSIIALW